MSRKLPVQIHQQISRNWQTGGLSPLSPLIMDTVEYQVIVALSLGQYSQFPVSVVEFPLVSTEDGVKYSLILNQMIPDIAHAGQSTHLVALLRGRTPNGEQWEHRLTQPFIMPHGKLMSFYLYLLRTYQVDGAAFRRNLSRFFRNNPLAKKHIQNAWRVQRGKNPSQNRLPVQDFIKHLRNHKLKLTKGMQKFVDVMQKLHLKTRTLRQKQLMYLRLFSLRP